MYNQWKRNIKKARILFLVFNCIDQRLINNIKYYDKTFNVTV